MIPRSTAWARAITILARSLSRCAVGAVAAASLLSVGCGMSPAYEPEPRVPSGYQATSIEPPTSEQLAASARAREATDDIAVGADEDEYSDTDPSALTEFRPALEGHGTWVDDSTYGTVWVPAEAEVGTDFVPYTTAGHWTYDDASNHVWVSDYSWGWAPFHYGRWVHVSRHGWAWIPGRTYSGAWVSWRTGGPDYGYVGWAPAGPDWYWYNGFAYGWTFGYSPYYSYCHRDYLYDPYVGTRTVRGPDPRSREYEAATRPYTPASPTVGGGGRVPASPTVGPSRTAASPRVGPRPSDLGIRSETVVPPPPVGHAGLTRAQVFSSPRTAVLAGAVAPVQSRRHEGVAAAPAARPFDGRGPATSSRIDAVARSPQIQGVSPVPPRSFNNDRVDSRATPLPRGFAEQPSASARPSMGSSSPSMFRSSPSVSASPSSPMFRSSPSASASQPTFRSSPSVSASQPSFRPSPSQPSFRSASPPASIRSSPSVSSPSRSVSPSVARPSSPSRSSAPAVRRGR